MIEAKMLKLFKSLVPFFELETEVSGGLVARGTIKHFVLEILNLKNL